MKASLRTTVAMALVALTVSTALSAGVVRTLDARIEGDVNFADGRIKVGDKSLPWDAVLYVMPDGRARTLGTPGAVRLVGGQVWRADILRLSAGRLTIRSRLWGRREIDAAGVTAIEFARGAPKAGGAKPATLYREDGEPIPGSLLWIDPSRLAIDSPLGVLTLSRKGLLCYVFGPAAARPADAPAPDEVGLVDGTVLRGRAMAKAGHLVLEHPIHGNLNLPAETVRYVRRPVDGASDLAALAPTSAVSTGVFGPQAAPAVSVRRLAETPQADADALLTLTVRPKTELRYEVAPGEGRWLVARLRPVADARGEVRVWIAAGDAVLDEAVLTPDAAPVPLYLELPPEARDLTVEVDFGRRIGFPCGAVFEDPLLIRR